MASWLRRTNAKERSAALSASKSSKAVVSASRSAVLSPAARVGSAEFADAGGCEGGLDFGVGAEGQGAFLEQQVGGHVGFG
jgi:hypothetical protein